VTVSEDRDAVIVAGIDGSSAADIAAHWAADEAALRSASLELLFAYQIPVVGHPEYEYPPEFAEGIRKAGRHTLDQGAEHATAAHPELVVKQNMTESDARMALVGESSKAMLTVVGSRGKGRLKEVLLGSVALHVASHAHSPVAVIPEASHTSDGAILLGVDGTDNSSAAIDFAFEEATKRGAEVVVLLGWDELAHQPFARRPVIAGRSAGRTADDAMAELRTRWCTKYPTVPVREVVHRDGSPAMGLLRYANQAARLPQAIVVGNRGRGGLSGLILGSTSHTLIVHSRCPVVIVRSNVTE
jgi:nucleotide-binding universal stress UspA family protein